MLDRGIRHGTLDVLDPLHQLGDHGVREEVPFGNNRIQKALAFFLESAKWPPGQGVRARLLLRPRVIPHQPLFADGVDLVVGH